MYILISKIKGKEKRKKKKEEINKKASNIKFFLGFHHFIVILVLAKHNVQTEC